MIHMLHVTSANAEELQGSFSLNLTESDIAALIAIVSEQTGKNFVIDPRVKGKVTVVSAKPMQPNELYQVFLSILQVHGFAAVPSGQVIKIVPDAAAKQSTIKQDNDGSISGGDELVTRVIGLKYVDAPQLVSLIRPMVPQQGHLAAYAPSNTLIFSDRSGNIDRILKIIAQIDKPTNEQIEIIPIIHSDAKKIVQTIKTLTAPTKGNNASKAPLIVADEGTNSILMSGDKSTRIRMRTIISHLDTPRDKTSLSSRIIRLQNADAANVAKLIAPIALGNKASTSTKNSASAVQQQSVSIQIDESTQTLVLVGLPARIDTVVKLINDLDKPRPQVLVEALIAEATTDKLGELGIQWRVPTGSKSTVGILGGLNLGGGSPSINSALTSPLDLGNGLALGLANGTRTVLGTQIVNFSVLLRALAGNAVTNILSAPNIVVRDNEEAEIVVGQNVPFLTGQFSSTGTGATPNNPFQTIERKDIGLTLKVKPRVSASGIVHMDISQEVSSVTSTSVTGASDLVTNKRSISTKVSVRDGNIVVLGGLIDDTVQETEQGIPVLSELPVIGALFRNSQSTSVKRNLMVFIRPIVLWQQEDVNTATKTKYEHMQAVEDSVNTDGLGQLKGEPMPRLPHFNNPGKHPIPERKTRKKTKLEYKWWQPGFSKKQGRSIKGTSINP